MQEPRDNIYTKPPSNRLHYILIEQGPRSFVVAEYAGHVALRPSDVFPCISVEWKPGAAVQQWQSALSFVIVSKPFRSRDEATDYLMHLTMQRIKDRPIVLEGQ